MTSTFGTASAATVDLGAEGLSPGDDLTPYLEDHWQGGNEVHIPGGSYTLSDPDALGISTSQDATLVGDGEVVADHGETSNSWNIVANGSAHVRVENITLRGRDTGGDSKIRPYAPSDDAVVEVVNFNRPDGAVNGVEASGFYVPREHAGLLRLINCHVEGFSDNGLYASSPRKGGNGPVEVYGGLYKNNDVSGVRIGSSDSKVVSVAIVNTDTAPTVDGSPGVQRGIRVREGGDRMLVEDCDVTHLDESGVGMPVQVRNDKFEDGEMAGDLTVRNTRVRNDTDNSVVLVHGTQDYPASGENVHLSGNGSMALEGAGPYDNVVEGSAADAPTTEKRLVDPGSLEPVGGGGGSSPPDDGSGDDSSDEDDSGGSSGTAVEVVAAEGGPLFAYTFVASGAISKVTDAGDMSAEGNDSVTENGDGTYTATGEVGNGFGDTFQVEGDLQSFEADTGTENYTLRVGGQEVDPSTLGDSDEDGSDGNSNASVEVVAAEGGPLFAYTFVASGAISKVTDAGDMSAEGNDTVTENGDGTYTATGEVGNGFGDTFQVEGDLQSFEADTGTENYTLRVGGQEVDPSTLGDSDDSSDGSDGADEQLPNQIVFDASDGGQGSYAFEVTGEVQPDPDNGPLEGDDAISGGSAEGELWGSMDAYRYSGSVVGLELHGNATVRIEDNE